MTRFSRLCIGFFSLTLLLTAVVDLRAEEGFAAATRLPTVHVPQIFKTPVSKNSPASTFLSTAGFTASPLLTKSASTHTSAPTHTSPSAQASAADSASPAQNSSPAQNAPLTVHVPATSVSTSNSDSGALLDLSTSNVCSAARPGACSAPAASPTAAIAMVTGTASGSAEGRVPRAIPWSSVLKDALIISIAPKALPYVQEKVLAWAQETLHTSSMKFSGQQFTVPVDLNQPNTASAKEYSRMLLAYSGTGIKLNNPNYKINFSDYRVAIDMDSELSHLSWSPLASSPNDGVLLDVTMVFKSMLVDVPTVNIQDLANPDFGKWTLTGIRVGNRKRTSAPFQANLQFKVGVSPSGALEVELLKSKTNFDQLRLLLAAQGVEISDINPRLAQLKALPADVLLMLFQDVIIQSAKENVQRALLVDGPRIMNEELKKIPENAKYTTLDYPPQSPKGLTEAEMLNIRFAPTQIRVDKYGILKVQLGAQIRDLVNHYYMRTFRPLRSYNRDLSGKDDLLIEINPDYMNLLLYQSFNRHYFAPMSGKGFELSFFEAPRFTVAPSGQFRVLAEMRLNMPPTIFRVQLNADFLKRSDGNFNMMATGTVKDSFEDRLEPNGVVEWAGNKVVNHLNAKFEDSPYMLQDGLPLPQSVGPLNIDYSRVEFETYNPDYRNNVKGGETGTVEIFGTVR